MITRIETKDGNVLIKNEDVIKNPYHPGFLPVFRGGKLYHPPHICGGDNSRKGFRGTSGRADEGTFVGEAEIEILSISEYLSLGIEVAIPDEGDRDYLSRVFAAGNRIPEGEEDERRLNGWSWAQYVQLLEGCLPIGEPKAGREIPFGYFYALTNKNRVFFAQGKGQTASVDAKASTITFLSGEYICQEGAREQLDDCLQHKGLSRDALMYID